MFRAASTSLARFSRRGLCLMVVLISSLATLGFAVAVWTAPMADMADMADMAYMADASTTAARTVAPTTVVGVAARTLNDAVAGDDAAGGSPSVASAGSLTSTSLCDTVCARNVNEVCAVAGGLTVTMLLVLLMSSRRDTFLGLKARARTFALRRQQRRPTPWALRSPIELCVLRV